MKERFDQKFTKYQCAEMPIVIPIIFDHKGFIFQESINLILEHIPEVSIGKLMKAALYALVRARFFAKQKYTK